MITPPPNTLASAPGYSREARLAWLQHMLAEGHTRKALADAVGMSPSAVYYAVNPARRASRNADLRAPKPDSKHKAMPRKCMTCRAPFESEGAHNRLCVSCRDKSDPFAWR